MSRMPNDPNLAEYADRLEAIHEHYAECLLEATSFMDVMNAIQYLSNATWSLWREAHDKK